MVRRRPARLPFDHGEHHVNTQNRLIASELQPASAKTRELLAALVDQETGQRGYVITGQDAYLEPYVAGRKQARARLDALTALFHDDPQIARAIAEVDRAVSRWQRYDAEPEIRARREDGARAAAQLFARGDGKAAFDRVRASVAGLQRMLDDRLSAAQSVAAARSGGLRDVVTLSALVRLLLFIVVALLLYRWVLNPIGALRASMRKVAEGDLTIPVEASGPPEVSAIGRDAESMRRRIVSELEAARAAGEALAQHSPVVTALRASLSESSVLRGSGVAVAGVENAAEGVLAGDWWDAVSRPAGTVALVLADVSGHGARAGLVALRLKERLTALLRTDLDLLAAFTAAAEGLSDEVERFASCFLAEVHPATGDVAWLNAGHPDALVARRARGTVQARGLAVTGPLVSTVTSGWEVRHTRLEPGELLVAVTDGVLEARRGTEEFGTQGLCAALGNVQQWRPQQAAEECVEAVRRFADDLHRDDVTCVVLGLHSTEDAP